MRESEIEKYLVRMVQKNNGLAPKWVAPGQRGVPDRIVILPNGKTVFVEMKAPGGALAPLQLKWARTLIQMGHSCYVIDTKDGVDRFIQEVFVCGVCTP